MFRFFICIEITQKSIPIPNTTSYLRFFIYSKTSFSRQTCKYFSYNRRRSDAALLKYTSSWVFFLGEGGLRWNQMSPKTVRMCDIVFHGSFSISTQENYLRCESLLAFHFVTKLAVIALNNFGWRVYLNISCK